jgi:hypothetical protein
MSQNSGPYAPRTEVPTADRSTTDVARDEAAGVGQPAREAGGQVAQTAGDQARQVVGEAGRQARDLLGEAQGHAQSQASAQQQRAAQQLRSVADEVGQMADHGGQSGVATEFARQAAGRMHGAASWLEQREPADVLDEVRNFARRRPGTFLIGAAVAGLAVGRLTRGLKDRTSDDRQGSDGPRTGYGYGRDPVPGIPATPRVEPDVPAGATYPAPTQPGVPGGPAFPPGSGPVGPAEPAYPTVPELDYPAEPGYPAAGTAGDDAVAYPADPVYEAGAPTPEDRAYPYPTEPGAGRRYEEPGPR